jgi:type IV pilus assembly protein PilO
MGIRDYKFENLPRSMQLAVLSAVAVALAGVFYSFYLQDRIAELDGLEAEVAALETSVAQTNAVASQLGKFKRDLAQLEQRLNLLRSILPGQKETHLVLRSVQEMAASSNLKITKFMPQPVVPRAFYVDWPIVMEVQGSYNAFGLFFEKISHYTRIVNVDNIAVKGLEGSTDPAQTLNATCTATTFVFREEPAAAAADKGALQ